MSIKTPVPNTESPTRPEVIANYDDYGEVPGRRTYARAATDGALHGGLIAGFVGLLFGLFNWLDPLISAVAFGALGVTFGAVFGALFGVLALAATNGERLKR